MFAANARPFLLSIVCCLCSVAAYAQAHTVIWFDDKMTAFDAPQPDRIALQAAFPEAHLLTSTELAKALDRQETQLLVLPYGSAFPVDQWSAIHAYLERGGNLLNLGGKAFTRAARLQNGTWKIDAENYAWSRVLLISDYQKTPASAGLVERTNHDLLPQSLPEFAWEAAYSPVIRLSTTALIPAQVGTSGMRDATIRPLLSAASKQHTLAAPIEVIDHEAHDYERGRWVLLSCTPAADFYSQKSAAVLLGTLAQYALQGAEELFIRPQHALFRKDEDWQFELSGYLPHRAQWHDAKLHILIYNEGKKEEEQTLLLEPTQSPLHQSIVLKNHPEPGLRSVTAELQKPDGSVLIAHNGFWLEDHSALLRGPKISVDSNYFLFDGERRAVMGTTYMDSDAQRLYFRAPNPYTWERDMKQIEEAGMNMLRTGWWMDWLSLTDGTTQASDETLRTIEAFLMTASKHHLAVQWNLFAFTPGVFARGNPYVGAEAIRSEQEFVASVAKPFRDVPFLMWDLINEPSFDNPQKLWMTRPNGDAEEQMQWNEWLLARYHDRHAVEEAWNIVLGPGAIPVPDERDYDLHSANDGGHPLAIYDFDLFAQEKFANWASALRKTIRATGSVQLITVGQDEGSGFTSPSPAFFHDAVDFTTMHSWWQNDALLWDSLIAQQNGKPAIVQETGVQNEFNTDGRTRRSPANEALLLERKLALAMGTGAGAIEWLWNINAQMRSQQEVTIGVIRPDGTERPEEKVMEAMARFAAEASKHLSTPQPASVVILASQAEQYSVLSDLELQATMRAVRTLNYACHMPARLVTENHVEELGHPELVVLPSAQMLSDAAWKSLLQYVAEGGHLLLTGAVERDEHWKLKGRIADLGIAANLTPITWHSSSMNLAGSSIAVTFSTTVQQRAEALQMPGGEHVREIAHGRGTIFIEQLPVELSDEPEATRLVYQYVLDALHLASPYTEASKSPSILIRPIAMKNSILYLIVSESSADDSLNIEDRATGTQLHVDLPAGRARLILLDRASGKILSSYEEPQL